MPEQLPALSSRPWPRETFFPPSSTTTTRFPPSRLLRARPSLSKAPESASQLARRTGRPIAGCTPSSEFVPGLLSFRFLSVTLPPVQIPLTRTAPNEQTTPRRTTSTLPPSQGPPLLPRDREREREHHPPSCSAAPLSLRPAAVPLRRHRREQVFGSGSVPTVPTEPSRPAQKTPSSVVRLGDDDGEYRAAGALGPRNDVETTGWTLRVLILWTFPICTVRMLASLLYRRRSMPMFVAHLFSALRFKLQYPLRISPTAAAHMVK
jgi:hypothetical protein